MIDFAIIDDFAVLLNEESLEISRGKLFFGRFRKAFFVDPAEKKELHL